MREVGARPARRQPAVQRDAEQRRDEPQRVHVRLVHRLDARRELRAVAEDVGARRGEDRPVTGLNDAPGDGLEQLSVKEVPAERQPEEPGHRAQRADAVGNAPAEAVGERGGDRREEDLQHVVDRLHLAVVDGHHRRVVGAQLEVP